MAVATGSFEAVDYRPRILRYQQPHQILAPSAAAKLLALLDSRAWPTEFAHGDLLPANLLQAGDETAVIDWEYAGLYLPGYDLALLWILLRDDPAGRVQTEALAHAEGENLHGAFLINRVLLLVRELRIHREIPPSPAVQHRLAALQHDLDEATDTLPPPATHRRPITAGAPPWSLEPT